MPSLHCMREVDFAHNNVYRVRLLARLPSVHRFRSQQARHVVGTGIVVTLRGRRFVATWVSLTTTSATPKMADPVVLRRSRADSEREQMSFAHNNAFVDGDVAP